jgi:integrase
MRFIKFDENTNPTSDYYDKLGKKEQAKVDKFEKYCLISSGKVRASKARSNAIRFLSMVKKKINEVGIEDLRGFLLSLKSSDYADYSKNDIKGFVKRFLKWSYKDWLTRFDGFDDVKLNSDATRQKKIESEDCLTPKQVSKLVKKENSLSWKAFILTQYEGALRTLEVRSLKWAQIDMSDPDIYWIDVSSKKNRNGTSKERISPPLEKAVYFLNELKKESNSPYVFPQKIDDNKFISSGCVSKWFKRLSKRVLGKPVTNYLLRHTTSERFHVLEREGKLSKANACQMLGHNEKTFDKHYSHTDKKEMKKLLKTQVLDVEYIEPEKKHALETNVADLKRQVELLAKGLAQVQQEGIPVSVKGD